MTDSPDKGAGAPEPELPVHKRVDALELPCRPVLKPEMPWRGMAAGAAIILCAMALLMLSAIYDTLYIADKPWVMSFTLFEVPEDMPDTPTHPVRARLVSRPTPLDSDLALRMLGQLVSWERFEHQVRLSDPELVMAVDLSEEEIAPLIASGRMPERGRPEVLAGPLARNASFVLDDVEFEVVGRLYDTVSAFLFAYMLPDDGAFDSFFVDEQHTGEGILVVAGDLLIEAGVLPDPLARPDETHAVMAPEDTEAAEAEAEDAVPALLLPSYKGGMLLSSPTVAYLSTFALMLAALGGGVFYFGVFKRLHAGKARLLRPIVSEVLRRPLLFWAMHLLLYGVFFLSMATALGNPIVTWRITQYIEAVFSHGGLGYVGAAYASGDVPLAAWVTFYNNYIEQTLGLTFLISLAGVPLGLIKTLLSFALVGGAMAPMWVGAAQGYVLHVITLALELEAYIVACFAIVVWPVYMYQGVKTGTLKQSLRTGGLMLLSAALLTGIMLAIAACYEAFTLIHLV